MRVFLRNFVYILENIFSLPTVSHFTKNKVAGFCMVLNLIFISMQLSEMQGTLRDKNEAFT